MESTRPANLMVTEGHPDWERLGDLADALPDELVVHIISSIAGDKIEEALPTLWNALSVNKQWSRCAISAVLLDSKLWAHLSCHTTALTCTWLSFNRNPPVFSVSQYCIAQMIGTMSTLATSEWPSWGGGMCMAAMANGPYMKEMYGRIAGKIPELNDRVLVSTFRSYHRIAGLVAKEIEFAQEAILEPELFNSATPDQISLLQREFKESTDLTPAEAQAQSTCLRRLRAQTAPEPAPVPVQAARRKKRGVWSGLKNIFT